MLDNLVVDTTTEVVKQGLFASLKATAMANPITTAVVTTAAVAGLGYGIYRLCRKDDTKPLLQVEVSFDDPKVVVKENN